MNEILSDAKKIIHNAIQTSLPDEAVKKFIGGKTFAFEGRVIVIAIGKAAWNMAKAAAENIPHRIDAGIVLTKYDHAKGEIPGFTILEAGHPLPDENTILGTQKIMGAVSGLTEKDTVFFLVSGGGSALFECPAGELTLADFLDITDQLLKCGADKVSVNSGAIRNPELIREAAQKYGNQCVVLSVDVKRVDGKFMVFAKGGRENTGMEALPWIARCVEMGAGEVVVNSIDTDGVKQGFDLELLKEVCALVNVPVIASGGAGCIEDFVTLFREIPDIDAGLAASIFHFGEVEISALKERLAAEGIIVRR